MSRADRRRIEKGMKKCRKCATWKKSTHQGKEQFLSGLCRKCFQESFKDEPKMLAAWEVINE